MIGIDVSDRSIKVVEITGEENAWLRTAGWSPVEPGLIRNSVIQDVPAVQKTLQRAMQKCSPAPQGNSAVLSIPERQSFVRVLELPSMSDTELNEAILWAIREHIPYDLDRMYIDWQLLQAAAKRPGYRQVLIGAAQKNVIDPLLQVVDGIGLQVQALELEAQAFVRSLLPRDCAEVQGVLLIDLGATSTNIIFFDQGAIRFTTSLQRGGDYLTEYLARELKIDLSIATDKKALVGVQDSAADASIAATLRAATFQLVQQINQIVVEITTQIQSTSGLRAILLAGGAANLPGLLNIFAEVFPGVPVQLGSPWINLVVNDEGQSPPLSPADATHFTTAIGLALRLPAYA